MDNKIYILYHSKGNIRISQLAKELFLSDSAFEKRFRKIVRASPKKFAKIVRLRNTIITVKN